MLKKLLNNLKRNFIYKLLIIVLFLNISNVLSQAPQSGTGHFDINKVRVLSGQNESLGNFSPIKKESDSYAMIILRIIFYLAIVIGVILAVGWIVRKAGIAGASRIGGGGSMDILEVLPFGQNRNAVLIRVMDTVYLIGQTPNNIVLLEKIEGQKAIDLIASSKGGSSVVQFKDAFNNFIGKIKKSV